MERNIPRLLLIHLIFFVLSTPPCAVTTGLRILKVVPISDSSTWAVAQNYCRWYHSDLITIRNQQEADKYAPYEGWIGLYLNTSSWEWKWSRGDERATFFNWDSSLILVQEKKTWEQALVHCRQLEAAGSTTRYQLAVLSEPNDNLMDTETIRLNANTYEVWVGLRFLAGDWLWMSPNTPVRSNLPQCPAEQQHCGALVPDNTEWKIMSCSEKRNFLCSRTPTK
ncbi:uncharacterized protein LOC144534788 isoform X2 [Sander vitreus]